MSPAVQQTEYLEFHEVADTGKTKVWSVRSRHHGFELATVRWYGPWRAYVLRPTEDTLWNVGCLNDINAFITMQMQARRKVKA